MKKLIVVLFLFLISFLGYTQELKCTVTVNYDRITNVNPQIFKTLQNQMTDFLNNTKFSDRDVLQNEKIECSFYFNVSTFDSNDFSGTMQIQSSRTIFNSNYSTPILNLNDNDIGFRYIENENFIYDPNSFTSNLISILTFYANIIIGVDADTFQEYGGSKSLETAASIMNLAQSGGYNGWNQTGSKKNNRYFLISDLISNTFAPYRKGMYEYHLKGLDTMSMDTNKAKENVLKSLNTIAELNSARPNALLTRTFFDAKADEIVSVFSGGPTISVSELVDLLNKISPLNSDKWNNIR